MARQGHQLQSDSNEILCELCKISGKPGSDAAGKGLADDWKHVGQVLDRFFFIIFMMIQLILIFITFGLIPWD